MTLKQQIRSEFIDMIEAGIIKDYRDYISKVKQELDRQKYIAVL